jgi:hypothetical protein
MSDGDLRFTKDETNRKRDADLKIGAWLSAALEDPSTCQSMKYDINEWFECTPQIEVEAYDQTALELCDRCGWKTLIPDDGCLNCNRHEWVGLTNEEVGTLTVFDGLHDVETPLLTDFARAIESKIKEKNA